MSEINIKKPSMLQILFIISGLIWFGVIAGTFYISSDIPKTTDEEKRRAIMRDTTALPVQDYSQGKIVPGVQIDEVINSSEELIALGVQLYTESCASCHGDDGRGDGAGGAMLNPKPRDFLDTEGWKNGRELTGMFQTLVQGIPGSGMNAYEFLPVKDRFALIYYIRTFGDEPYPAITRKEIEDIDAIYDIQRDTKAGAQIPIKVAERKVIEKQKENPDEMLARIESDKSKSCILFDKIVSCKKRAVLTLIENKEWRKDTNIFFKVISSNTQQNGFKPAVALLQPDEVSNIHRYLLSVFNPDLAIEK